LRTPIEVLVPDAQELGKSAALDHALCRVGLLPANWVVALEGHGNHLGTAEQCKIVDAGLVLHRCLISSQRRCAASADSPVLASALPPVMTPNMLSTDRSIACA